MICQACIAAAGLPCSETVREGVISGGAVLVVGAVMVVGDCVVVVVGGVVVVVGDVVVVIGGLRRALVVRACTPFLDRASKESKL